jgi:hypothetical protein
MKNISCLNRSCLVGLNNKRIRLSGLLALIWILLAGDLYSAESFNQYEMEIITEKIETSFELLIDTWNEELYFEMYDFGQRNSQKRLSRGEFAQRMVDLKWKPTLAPMKIDRIDILYRNFAVIYFWMEFGNKVNLLQKIKKYITFPIILENNDWKFDLTQLIRIPFEGKLEKPIIKVKAAPEPKEKTDIDATGDQPQPPAESEAQPGENQQPAQP